jgi:UDP-N-acetylmuramate--alanine ligase
MRWRDFDKLAPLPDDFFQNTRRVHFIGIGGIGMSALAFVLASRGHQISGSDANESAMLDKLRRKGVLCVVGHDEENLELLGENADAVIFGSAISESNPEHSGATRRSIPIWHRAQLLAYFVNNAKFSIAVSGTHGKSTTSAMVAHILDKCGKNPTAILGAEYPPFGSNARIGDEDLIVVEADESDGSFTLLKPSVAVVTNVEPEHLENYDNSEEELWRAFRVFRDNTSGWDILNIDDEEMCRRIDPNDEATTFGFTKPTPFRGSELRVHNQQLHFKLTDGNQYANTSLSVPGEHNASNALGAIAASKIFGIALLDAAEAIKTFHGVKRRFQKLGEENGVVVYDDYGHHPTEVESTLRAAKEFLQRPVVVIFQPHRYSRTQQLGRDFGPSFEAAEKVIITQLYSAFEEPIEGVSGRIVFDAVRESFPDKEIHYAENLDEAKQIALQITKPGDALFTMGAGDVTTLGPQLLDALKSSEATR